MTAPNVIIRQPVFFDVLCEHDPSGKQPDDVVEGTLRVQCWVRKIAAYGPEEAARKAERFLTEHRHIGRIRVKKWRFSSRPSNERDS